MKINLISIGSAVAVFLGAGLQAYATTTFTETLNLGSGTSGPDVYNTQFFDSFTDANLKSGSTSFVDTADTITSAYIDLTLTDAAGHEVTLWLDLTSGHTSNEITVGSIVGNTPDYTLNTTEIAYLQGNNPITFAVEADCYLNTAELIVNANVPNGGGGGVPDGASTGLLLGGAISALALIKRKLS